MTASEIRCAIELREDDSRQSPGYLDGVLMTYAQRARSRAERFAQDALYWDTDGIVLNLSHRRDRPVIRFTPHVEGREVRISIPLPDTVDGRDAATMVRNGTLRGLSIEFHAEREGRVDGLREVRRARLAAAGLVDSPDYVGALEVREGHVYSDDDLLRLLL